MKFPLLCQYCKDDFHEACESIIGICSSEGIVECQCVCNIEVKISQ